MIVRILTLTLLCFWTGAAYAQSSGNFAREEVIADLDYLYKSLEDAHFNVNAYTSKADLDAVYESVRSSITTDSLTLLEATSTLQRMTSAVNNGHTEIDFPVTPYFEYAYSQGTVFPLELAFEDGKCLVRKNFSGNGKVSPGTEVLGINGMSIEEVMEKIYPQVSAERPYFKHAKIEMYSFPRYYWQVFGQQEYFDVEIAKGAISMTHRLNAVNLIEDYEMIRSEVLNAAMKLEFFDAIAYINPGHFGGDEQVYHSFIDSAFATIRQAKSSTLIIDLRNNAGGDNSFSDYLVSYIADKPFSWCSRFSLKTSDILKQHTRLNNDTTESYFRTILDRPSGEVYDYEFEPYAPQPEEQRFTSDVYVLLNRQTHSQAAVTAAQIQDQDFGTLVGEESGEYPSLYASQIQFSLPNTEIVVKVSKGYMVRVNGSEQQEGVIPDIVIRDHLLDEEDEILEGLISRLSR